MIRIQPQEAIYMKINNKVPGLGMRVQQTRLDLKYAEDLQANALPDAYERLLLDVVNGAPPLPVPCRCAHCATGGPSTARRRYPCRVVAFRFAAGGPTAAPRPPLAVARRGLAQHA